jgi:hypothetical protein
LDPLYPWPIGGTSAGGQEREFLSVAYVPATTIWMLPESPQMNRVNPLSDSQLRSAIAAHADEVNLAKT